MAIAGRTNLETPIGHCRFGIAWGDITPPIGIYHRMWGAAVHDRAEGVHQPLRATAVVFRPLDRSLSDDSIQVLIALDHCLFGNTEVAMLQRAVAEKTGIDGSAITVLFSHTHAAGLMLLDRAGLPGGELIPPYLQRVNSVAAELVARAVETAAPATMTYGTGRCGLARNRDQWDAASRQWVCGLNPDGPADDTLVIARVTDASNRMLASIVNYACHPTTLAWDNRLISPDYPGSLRQLVEEATDAPCVFLQGAAGELGPRDGYVGDVAVAERNGRQVGYAALATLAGLPPPGTRCVYAGPVVSGATLGIWRHEPLDEVQRGHAGSWGISHEPLMLDYRSDLPRPEQVTAERDRWLAAENAARQSGDSERARDCRAHVERWTRMQDRLRTLPAGDKFPYPLRVWRVGDAVWIAVQGEPYSLLQTELRRRFPQVPLVVCSLANGWGPSYLPPAEAYGSGRYQESIAVLAPGSLEQIVSQAANRINELLSA